MSLTRLHRLADRAIELAKLDLAKTDTYGGCYPAMPQPYYPSLYIDREDDSINDIPEEGTATISYKMTHRSISRRNGKKTSSATLDIMSIEPAKKAKKADKLDELNARMDEILFTDRTRDTAGQFAPQQPPGMDATTMRAAYDPKSNAKRQSIVAGAAKTALVGAGLVGAYKVGRGAGRGAGVDAVNRLRKRASAGRSARANVRKTPGFGEHVASKMDAAAAARRARPAQ